MRFPDRPIDSNDKFFFICVGFCLLFTATFSADIRDLEVFPKVIVDEAGFSADVAIHPLNKSLYVVWVNNGDIKVKTRNPEGQWSETGTIPDAGTTVHGEDEGGWARSCVATTIGRDGITRVVFGTDDGRLYVVRGVPGQWESPILVVPDAQAVFPDIEVVENREYIVYENGVRDEIWLIESKQGVWGTPVLMSRGEYPSLASDEDGVVYFLSRNRAVVRNAVFAYLLPDATSWTFVEGATDAQDRLGADPKLTVWQDKIYMGWSNSSGIDGPEKSQLYCAVAQRPGDRWISRLGGTEPLYYESTGDPHPRAAVYDDGTVMILNGNRRGRFKTWDGNQWNSTRRFGPWQSGIAQVESDGSTVWVAVSTVLNTREEVSVTGIRNPGPDEIDDLVMLNSPISDPDGYSGRIAVSPLDLGVHALWVHEGRIHHCVKNYYGDWSDVEVLPLAGLTVCPTTELPFPAGCLALDIDNTGLCHVIFSTEDGGLYSINGVRSDWGRPTELARFPVPIINPDVKGTNDRLTVVYQKSDDSEIFSQDELDGQWSKVEHLSRGEHPFLTPGGDGRIYLLFQTRSEYIATKFGQRIAGYTAWSIDDVPLGNGYRPGERPALTVIDDDIFMPWTNDTGLEGEWRSELYCARATEGGAVWQNHFGGRFDVDGVLCYDESQNPYPRTSAYSDGRLLYLNGQQNQRFLLWTGSKWTKPKRGVWPAGALEADSDGRTVWLIVSGKDGGISVAGIQNPLSAPFKSSAFFPVIVSAPDTTAVIEKKWSYQCQAEDSDNDPLLFELLTAPDGMTIETTTGYVEWTPTMDHAESDNWNMGRGIHLVGIGVTDADQNSDGQYFWLRVGDGNDPPRITSAPMTTCLADSLYRYEVEAFDPEGDSLIYFLLEGPANMTIDSVSGMVTWRPQIADVGQHAVDIKVRDAHGGFDTQRFILTVYIQAIKPVCLFTAEEVSGAVPFQVHFEDQSTGTISSWNWSFGDGESSEERNPVHTYLKPGSFDVRLIVNGAAGSDTLTQEGFIYAYIPSPLARFGAEPLAGLAPLTVQFTDSSTGPITSWHWNFGDGEGGTIQNPTHIYRTAGSYSVTLTVHGPGGMDSLLLNDLINVSGSALRALFSAVPREGPLPLAVQFTDASTGQISAWNWDFGDGNVDSAQNPVHTYHTAGNFPVTLTVSGPEGVDTKREDHYIHVYTSTLRANFSASPLEGIVPLVVQFADSSSGDITFRMWNFGDSTMSTMNEPLHSYRSPGIYTVSLTVSGPEGADTEIKTGYIRAREPAPRAHFSAFPLEGLVPLTVQFHDSSTGNVTSWFWDFGDSTTSTIQHPIHVYDSPGLFGVKLTISGPGGSDTVHKSGLILAAWPSGVYEEQEQPRSFRLFHNYPNPFNDKTVIMYEIPHPVDIGLRVYDIGGKYITTLAEGYRDIGRYREAWNGRDDKGYPVASGVYIIHLTSVDYSQTQKVLFLK